MAALQQKDIRVALESLGVCRGESICVHSFSGAFGHFEGGLKTIADGLLDAVGPQGNLIVPTYNYDFFRGVPYDPDRSPSQVGQLSEYCRSQLNFRRTFHPVYSHAILGPYAEDFLANPSTSGFGEGSDFWKMHQAGIKLIYFGIAMNSGGTFLHYVEETAGVPYRFVKDFPGQVLKSGQMASFTAQIYSRRLDLKPEPVSNLRPFQADLLANRKARLTELGRGEILVVSAENFFQRACEKIKEDPFYFLEAVPR